MKTAYLVPKDTLEAPLLRGLAWTWTTIPGDPLDRVFLLIEHPNDEHETAFQGVPGVVALPHPLSRSANALTARAGVLAKDGLSLAHPLACWGVSDDDATFDVIEKVRKVGGWPLARL